MPKLNPGPMVGFGRKITWLAIKTADRDLVARTFPLAETMETDWETAVDEAYADLVLVTPPRPGQGGQWVLAAGDALAPIGGALWLSQALRTEVQLFATHRVSGSVEWARCLNGRLRRHFAKDDGVLRAWVGVPDEAELALGMPPLQGLDSLAEVGRRDAAALAAGRPNDAHQWLLIGEDDVLKLAAAWSLDPDALDDRRGPGAPLIGAPTWPID